MATYLVKKTDATGAVALEIASLEEWVQIIQRNKTVPSEQRRFFIKETSLDGEKRDTLLIEVDLPEYRRWNSQHTMALRNLNAGKNYAFVSFDGETDGDDWTLNHLRAKSDVENELISKYLEKDLRIALAQWKPWGNDLLDLYMANQGRSCSQVLSEKYSVSQVTVRKWKREFEIFIKNFLY